MNEWRVIVGDVREKLAELPDSSVQCVVTSPPYWGLRDYGVAGQLGLNQTPDEYVADLVAAMRQVRRVLSADGSLWLNLGDSYQNAKGQAGGFDPKQPKRVRQIQKATRISMPTIARYRRLWDIKAVCGCGDDSRHRGWCSYRYQQSPLRQAFIAAWSRARLGSGKVTLRWPFILTEGPTDEQALMLAINEAVPRWLPEDVRADLCQDVAVAVLLGECDASALGDYVRVYLPEAKRKYGPKWGHISIDEPGRDGKTMKERM